MTDPTIVLGLDLGDRHIGVAVGNLITRTATPLPDFANDRFLSSKIIELSQQYNFSKIIIGLPLTTTGQHGEQAHKVTELVAELNCNLPMEIVLEDERFTTQSAAKFLAENPSINATIDGASAKLILEGWLARQ
jgi:putative Holliday junction resolvase